ncbi:NgoMIV family type II restriction endonuclease [Pelagibaculum spongiae]|uniref:Restriction endonuclease n=1 Tax=Pelagibaculum spongiae TaxID=2080658 RepID=A0A2V1GS93_9GAMM|nr:NgoMIV family type II restriction endonuclease [Pelagibaculum spongiae]PVZ64918.1 restriction endonuclease [Pelagibaculum spongiae]
MSLLTKQRDNFHRLLIKNEILTFSAFSKYGAEKICSNADSGQKHSVLTANLLTDKIAQNLGITVTTRSQKKKGQTLGNEFEQACTEYLQKTFLQLGNLRPGNWQVEKINSRRQSVLGQYEQYTHLSELGLLADKHAELRNFLGDGYTVAPDIVISRSPETDDMLNSNTLIVDDHSCKQSALRIKNHKTLEAPNLILHASISCKFTMRSDRAQNTRTEALNLMRARKGRSPHIISLTAEPTVSRIASLALGTGDLDCVYHIALYELLEALKELDASEPLEQLEQMVVGKRIKDISDLPLDLAI